MNTDCEGTPYNERRWLGIWADVPVQPRVGQISPAEANDLWSWFMRPTNGPSNQGLSS